MTEKSNPSPGEPAIVPEIVTEIDGHLTIVRINRPARLNALNAAAHLDLRAALESASNDDNCRAVMLTGTGRGFCVGQDLGDRDPSKMNQIPDLGDTLRTYYNPTIQVITDMNKPVIAAVNGVAAGAGVNIALACDIVIATTSASFIQAFVKIGLTPDAGGSWILPRLIGMARAKGLAMTGMPLPAETAAEWGMIWACYPDDEFGDAAKTLGQQLANGPTTGLGLSKAALNASMGNTLAEQLDLEAKLQSIAGSSADYREGVSAFLEKRKAKFQGQ
ncbi:2-(1,2-epoxy-1,2-dihydrophenyl)acetyl-CoA isomerase PaaG [Alphaproteobacteria bacterium]|nr:2-(1,2-epoxy-1,2-dihydrophenyl)acetyl-CoA isomerase PaaG [Alphaproteobacteria bacterium]